jgi:hypothetical protein
LPKINKPKQRFSSFVRCLTDFTDTSQAMILLDDSHAAAAYRQRAALLRDAASKFPTRKKRRVLKEAADWEWRAECIEARLAGQHSQATPPLPLVA